MGCHGSTSRDEGFSIPDMKIAYKIQILHVHIECDNVVAFDMLVEQDEEEIEEEGLIVAVQQLNVVLYIVYNKQNEHFPPQKSCRMYFVYDTRNMAPTYMVVHALNYCSNLVEVMSCLVIFFEILDLDNDSGPRLPAFEILPTFALEEVVQIIPYFYSFPEENHLIDNHFLPYVNDALPFDSQPTMFGNDIRVISVDKTSNLIGFDMHQNSSCFPWVNADIRSYVDHHSLLSND
ncbi:hypothetical protein POM88_046805 [Heracleum sosnowskyi]|uniref:Uncharacterized protein n=1 Tax=Heracleum sosnowskyi TaxID=360622 RepID=A0AAD8H8G3_9APIA|nr:hypothetical protein POM88_046805 [Heracleum sosnowskyi]